jgi:3-oxoacyl-(acyl-carrier-protein) synthase III
MSGSQRPPVEAAIAGVGAHLPDRIVRSEEVEAALNGRCGRPPLPRGVVAAATGVAARHWRHGHEQCSDLALWAGRRALAQAGLDATELDAIFFAAASQDVAEPATANVVQAALGAHHAWCLDVKNACASFLNAVDLAGTLIASGRATAILVVSGEVLSPTVDTTPLAPSELPSRLASLTLGDAGGAVVVRARVPGRDGRLFPGAFLSDGRYWRASVIDSGGSRGWAPPRLACDGTLLAALARRYLPVVVESALEAAGWEQADVDLVVPHQVSQPMLDILADHLRFRRSQVVSVLAETGNVAAASIPVALRRAIDDGRCPPGTRALLLAGAGGFAAGCVAVEL